MRRRPERSPILAVLPIALVIGVTGCGSCGKGSEPENAPAAAPSTSAGKLGHKLLREGTGENNPRPVYRALARDDAGGPP